MANRDGNPLVGPRSDMDDPAYVARPWPNETLAARPGRLYAADIL